MEIKPEFSTAPAREIKDYLGYSFLTLGLYYLGLMVGGFIANIIFLVKSGRDIEAGYEVKSRGCLWALLVFHIILVIFILVPVIIIAVLALLGPVIGTTFDEVIRQLN